MHQASCSPSLVLPKTRPQAHSRTTEEDETHLQSCHGIPVYEGEPERRDSEMVLFELDTLNGIWEVSLFRSMP